MRCTSVPEPRRSAVSVRAASIARGRASASSASSASCVSAAANRPYSSSGGAPYTPVNASSNERGWRAVMRRQTWTRLESPRCAASHSRNADPARYAIASPWYRGRAIEGRVRRQLSLGGPLPEDGHAPRAVRPPDPANNAPLDEGRVALGHPSRRAERQRPQVHREEPRQPADRGVARLARGMRDVRVLVDREQVAPCAIADRGRRTRRRGPEEDRAAYRAAGAQSRSRRCSDPRRSP